MLCLANGERVSLTNNMRLLFEVDDLSNASPATISRCAMVYMVICITKCFILKFYKYIRYGLGGKVMNW